MREHTDSAINSITQSVARGAGEIICKGARDQIRESGPAASGTSMTDRPEGIPEDAEAVRHKYAELTRLLIETNTTITTMESCTAGQIASLITDTEGSSAIFRGAFVTYSNEAKIRSGVPEEIIEKYGVYSSETACAMAMACRDAYSADIGIGVTGSFGNPDPNNADSIPGEVYIAVAVQDETKSCQCTLPEQLSRPDCKLYVAERAADMLLQMLIP